MNKIKIDEDKNYKILIYTRINNFKRNFPLGKCQSLILIT
jgi:hypothetical protein